MVSSLSKKITFIFPNFHSWPGLNQLRTNSVLTLLSSWICDSLILVDSGENPVDSTGRYGQFGEEIGGW